MIRWKVLTALGDPGIYIGEREYTTGNGTFYFTVPQAVRRIHACAIGAGAQGAKTGLSSDYEYDWNGGGGGGLGWANNIEVEPGEVLCVIVGNDCGIKRTEDDNVTETGDWLVAGLHPTKRDGYGDGGQFVGDGGGNGGSGCGNNSYSGSVKQKGSGGGAGGYRGRGGHGSLLGGDNSGSGGAGSGGVSGNLERPGSTSDGARGGGVGIKGQGASGVAPRPDKVDLWSDANQQPGLPGSGGDAEKFGAGGAGEKNGWNGSEKTKAGRGAVRIIWGNRFSYPDNADIEAVE